MRSTNSSGLSVEKDLIVTVTNVNKAPTDIGLAPASVNVFQPVGTIVGNFSTRTPTPAAI